MIQWKEIRLGDHLSFITSGSRGWGEYYASDGALFLRIQNVGYNELRLEDIAFVQPPDGAEARRTRVQPGDVLLSITADLGRTAVIPEGLGTAHINQHLAILRVKDIDPHYLAAFLSLGPGRLQLKRLDRVGVKSGLNFDDVRSLRILLPSLPEQRRIVAILDKADAIYRKRARAIRLTEDFLRSTFLETFGDPAKNPKGWPTETIGELIERGIVLDHQDGNHGEMHPKASDFVAEGVPFVPASALLDNRLRLDRCPRITEGQARNLRVGFAQSGDVLLSHKGSIGLTDIVPDGRSLIILTPQITYFRVDGKILTASYLTEFFKTAYFQSQLELISQQSTRAYAGLIRQRSLEIMLPSCNLQRRFADIRSALRRLIKNEDSIINTSECLSKALVQRAFRGEL